MKVTEEINVQNEVNSPADELNVFADNEKKGGCELSDDELKNASGGYLWGEMSEDVQDSREAYIELTKIIHVGSFLRSYSNSEIIIVNSCEPYSFKYTSLYCNTDTEIEIDAFELYNKIMNYEIGVQMS